MAMFEKRDLYDISGMMASHGVGADKKLGTRLAVVVAGYFGRELPWRPHCVHIER